MNHPHRSNGNGLPFWRQLLAQTLLALILTATLPGAADEVLCYTQRVTDAASFNVYTGKHDANNPIVWRHTVPSGILARVVRVGLYIEAWDVDGPPIDDEHDRVYFNGHDLGLLEGFNDTWITVEKTVPVEALREGVNELRVEVDQLDKNWKVTIRASELRFYCRSAEPDFSLGVDPAALTVRQGETDRVTLTVTGLNEFTQAVGLELTGLPAGVSARFAQDHLFPTPLAQTVLTLEVAGSVPVGVYDLVVRGRAGEIVRQVGLRLRIDPAPIDPVYELDISATPEQGRPPLAVQFSARFRGEQPPVGTVYDWSFGDGESAEGSRVTHTFGRPGLYTVRLAVALPVGKTLRAEKQIDVFGFNGMISLDFSRSEALPGETVDLRVSLHNPELQDISDLKFTLPLNEVLTMRSVRSGPSPDRSGQKPVWHIPLLRGGETLVYLLEIGIDGRAKPQTVQQTAELNQIGLAGPIVSQPATLAIKAIKPQLVKTVDLAMASVGAELIYTIRLKHPGATDLPSIKLVDELPGSLVFISANGPLTLLRRGNQLTWSGKLEAGAELEWRIRARIRQELLGGERIENQARLGETELTEEVLSNLVFTTVSGLDVTEGQLLFDHRCELPQSEIGRTLRMRVSLVNRSPSVLHQARIEVRLPSGFDYLPGSSLIDGARKNDPSGRGRLVYHLDSILSGQSLSLQYQMVIGSSSRRGPNICRAELFALSSSHQELMRTADARINVSGGGLVFMSGIEGVVYLDQNNDGRMDGSDQPLPGIEVMLSSGERAVSDEMGRYLIGHLYPGDYLLGINRAGLDERYTLPAPQSRIITLSDGLTDWLELPVLFAGQYQQPQSRLEGRVFYDKNRNHRYDAADEPLVREFAVRIDNQTLTRGRDGRFVFSRLSPGDHRLEIEAAGIKHTTLLKLKEGAQIVDIALKYSAIRILINGETK